MSHEIKGKLIIVNEIKTFPSGFTKREFVIETEGDKYPQKVKFELTKDKCSLIDRYEIGSEMTVHFNVNGNEFNGKYFVSLQAWKIDGDASQAQPMQRPTGQNGAVPSSKSATADALDEDSDIPF